MAEEERKQPSLELPSLFRRRSPTSETEPVSVVERVEPTPTVEPVRPEEPRDEASDSVETTPRVRRPFATPSPVAAAPIVGALVGLLAIGLTWLGLQGCASVRGTSTCGDPGLLVVAAIVAVMALAGVVLLRLLRVAHPTSTSVLGTVLVAVLTLLLPEASYESTWVLVAMPVCGALAFAAAYALTAGNTEPGDRAR